MTINIKGFTPTESQQLIIDSVEKYKYTIASYSRQQGKSTVASFLVICWLLNQDEEIIYFTPTFNLAKNFYSKIIKLLPKEIIIKSNSSDLIIETITNSKLRFFSGEAAQTARGNNCTRMIIDEAAYIKDEIDGQKFWFNIVQPLLKVKGKTCLMISTPFGKQGFFYELAQKAIQGFKGYNFIKRTIYQDELISKEDIEELKKGYPPLAWECEFMCEFMANALSVFPEYDDRFINNFNFNKLSRIWCGVDLSTVGEDNTIVTLINSENQVLQYKIDGDLDTKYNLISNIINQYKPIGTYIESNSIGTPIINEILKQINNKTNVLPFQTTNDTKKQQVGFLSVAISNKKITFDNNNTLLYSELGSFTYKLTKNGNITYSAEGTLHDDTVMSLCLALQAKEDFTSTNNLSFVRRTQRNIYT